MIISFGCIYYYLQNAASYLYYVKNAAPVNTIQDTIYFSFISATTTGFGDIVPIGYFKVIAILEVIFGFLLLALVTSKLVSIKQDVILNELYDLSVMEKVNKVRSALLLFRQNLDRVMNKIEDKTIRKREVNNIYLYLSAFEDTINETLVLLTRPGDNHFIKNMDQVNTELIFNSIINSFEKFFELISLLNQHGIDWKTEINVNFVNQCIILNENLFSKLNLSTELMRQVLLDLNVRKNMIITKIKDDMAKKQHVADVNLTTYI
jgi:hypothetical protein